MTALENVALPLELAGEDDAFERAEAELQAVGLGHRLHHYPAQLSGGEQQRVAIARAIVPNPAILVADEPTGNLDETTGESIIDLLFALKRDRGATLVLVTHDLNLARLCDRMVRLRSGQVEADAASAVGLRISSHARHPSRHAASGLPSASRLPLLLRLALRELRGGLQRLRHLPRLHRARRRGDRQRLLPVPLADRGHHPRGPPDPRRRHGLFPAPARGERGRAGLPGSARAGSTSIASMRAMAVAGEKGSGLVEMKAVDGGYPTVGALETDPQLARRRSLRRAQRRLRRGGRSGAPGAARPEGRRPGHGRRGADASCGRASSPSPTRSPTASASGRASSLSQEALQATGLVQPGSLVRWTYRLHPAARRSRPRRG